MLVGALYLQAKRHMTTTSFTTPAPLPESISVDLAIVHVRQQLRVACREFAQSAYVEREMGKASCEKLLKLLDSHPETLGFYSYAVRQEFIGHRDTIASTVPFWAVIDSVGFLGDAAPGRWPYMTDQDKLRNLRWSLDEAVSALSIVYH